MIVTFCGHRDVERPDEVRAWLLQCTGMLIEAGASEFLLGGCGAFDRLAADAVASWKARCPHVRATLVLAYLDRPPARGPYDGNVYPPLENAPRRYAIARRNEWMVRQADAVIAYVQGSAGGAARTLRAARRMGKAIYLYPSLSPRPPA